MSEYYPADSIVHRLDPRTKFLVFACLIVLVMYIQDPIAMFFISLMVLATYKIAKIPLKRVKGMVMGVIPVIVLFVLLNIFVVPTAKATIIGYIGTFPIALESILIGLTGGFRFAIFVFYSRLLTMTTSIAELTSSLVKLKMPAEVAVALGIGFSSVGILIDQLRTIKEAQMSRGASIESRNPIAKAAALISVMVPAVYLTIIRGLSIARVLESRAFTYNPSGRTFRKVVKLKKCDYVTLAMAFAITITVVTLVATTHILGYTYSYEIISRMMKKT
ncbi:MAG: energy-coupling factor transporter transmembrane component T [Desulfurococcaceae archaeon]